MNDLATNTRKENNRDLYRGIDKFQRGNYHSSNFVKEENGDLLADIHNILNRWRTTSLLLNAHGISDIRQIEIYTVETLVSGPSHKSSDSDQILVELIQAACEI
jgi:hypothetical protein